MDTSFATGLFQGFLRSVCRCTVCGEAFQEPDNPCLGLCGRCRAGLVAVPEPACERCGQPLFSESGSCLACRAALAGGEAGSIRTHRSLYLYAGTGPALMFACKSSGWRRLARFLAGGLEPLLERSLPTGAILCPVPSLARSDRRRGFNQLDLLLGCLGPRMARRRLDLLERRGGAIQKELDRADRLANLAGHVVPARNWRHQLAGRGWTLGQPVLLLDDVRTTGASLEVCARVLLDMGFTTVDSASIFLD